MIETIYIETELLGHQRAEQIIKKYSRARVVECGHYGEVFNRKKQNFRVQKTAPALILAKKNGRKIYPAPSDHAIGATHNYYFAHLLNCPFDCRYCFLQGKFDSANYVLFVNYEDFWQEIEDRLSEHAEATHIFSGYDGDSLAFEPVTGFVTWLLEQMTISPTLFSTTQHLLELRTKSSQIRQILKFDANPHCLIAYSLAPQSVITNFEHDTANLEERLRALARLQNSGWQIGLRIDPLIEFHESYSVYQEFFKHIANTLDLSNVHSVTLGTMRFPLAYFNKVKQLYPNEALFSSMNKQDEGGVGYAADTTNMLVGAATEFFAKYIDSNKVFVHHSDAQASGQ